MEEKTIEISSNMGRVRLERSGAIKVENNTDSPGVYIGMNFGNTAREFAHAILELIGDPVPGKGDSSYIAVVKAEYGYFLGGRIVSAISGPMNTDTAIESLEEDAPEGEFHIFRRVATVGPIPQPERKVTRYE